MFIISSTPGRLGNQIYQLFNIIYSALENKQQINVEKLKGLSFIFDLKLITDNFNLLYKENNLIKCCHFFPRNLHLVEKRTINLEEYFNISKQFIQPYMIDLPSFESTICVIHMRSGDQFKNSNTHPSYVQPPLNYYCKIIDEFDDRYSKFIVLTEPDMKNPCINALKNYSNKVEIRSNTTEEDYKFLLRAQNIVLCRSTFSDSVVFLSKHIKNLYLWNYCHCFTNTSIIPKHINVKSLELEKPYIECGSWKNNNEQLQLMINYKKEDIKFVN